ncbi:GATA zinc finger domain-containing protein 14-like [Rhopalosiphum padi]|uniref:GATA zinc finger domain-containing protein 14-like n=1 Tax=Rhopalosiphum padi TaxID=40932 RepID=UPI00298DBF0B|nr:GATA zinc finger domain-containing protein 14-like [Rhopalosiphum padi]
MNQQFPVLGFLFYILILAENSTTVLNNVLQSNPMNMENNHSTIQMKTMLFNRNITNFNRTKNLNILNSTWLNSSLPVTPVITSSQINRFPRHVQQVSNKSNNEETEYKRYIKVILDLKPDKYEDMYDSYDDGKNNDNRGSLIDELILHKEIEQNSKPITRNLDESRERKRCTKKITQNLGSTNHQQSQKLLLRNIEDGIEPTIKCTDCELLKSNINSKEPNNNYDSNLQLEQKDDDYFIKVLNQLIDKINKPKNVKSNLFKNLPIQTSIEPTILENSLVENQNTNSSSGEEVIVKFEKIKGNRIVNKLESSPENIFVNGNWVRNKLIENKINDCKPIVNDRRNELNDKNESISNNEMKQLNLKDSKNQVIETDDNISSKLKDLSVVTEENKYILTSPLTDENKHLLFSRETSMPFVVSSTSKYKPDSNTDLTDDNYKFKFTTKDYTDQFNKEENVSNHEKNNKSQYELTVNNFPTTVAIFESSEELTSDLNEASKIKNSDKFIESNDNNPKTNFSDEETIVENSNLEEKENNSPDDNVNCSCNKKIIKNILSSTMVTNITEIKTDLYTSPNSLKMNSNKRSNQLPQKNSKINQAKNITNENHLMKNKKDLNSDFLGKKQVIYESTGENNLKESNVNSLEGPILNIDDNQSQDTYNSRTNKNKKIDPKNSLFKSTIPELKLKGQIKRNNDENINNVEEINNDRKPLISKTLPQKKTRQFIVKLKRFPQNDDNNMDKITENNNISTKNSAQMLNKISLTPLQSISSKQKENITKNSPRKLIEKMKNNILINGKIHTESDNNKNYITSSKKIFTAPRILSQIPLKINNHSPQSTPRNLEKPIKNYDFNATKNSPRKFITESVKYNSFNPNSRNFKNLNENNNKNIISRKDSINTNHLDPVQLQRPSSFVKNIEKTKIQTTPKNKILNTYSTKIPTYIKSGDISTIKNKYILKSKISKPALLIQSPKIFSSSNTTKQMKNNENIPLLKLNKSLNNAKTKSNSEPLFLDKIDKTKYNFFDKTFTLPLKNKNILNDQSPTEQVFIKKTDTNQNLKLKYDDANLNFLLKSNSPEKIQVEDLYDHEHAPYTNEDLEPIVFDELTKKANISNKNSPFIIQSANSRQFPNENQRRNKLGVKLLQSVPNNQLEYDENYDSQKKNKFEANVKKHKNQPNLNKSNNFPINTVTLDNDKYNVSNPNDEYSNPNKFGVLSQVKIADGVFKIPLVSQTSVDNNGSEYVSEIFIPIEKPDGKHSAISLTKLLTGDFKLLNEPGVERLSVIKPTSEIDSTLSSTRNSTDCESKEPVNPILPKILQAIRENESSVPIHIIQIINNGQCSYKDNGTDTIKKIVHDDDKHKFHKIHNEDRRLSSIRSQNTPDNNKKIHRNIENAYNHFDSAILDRFLQVYSPHIV